MQRTIRIRKSAALAAFDQSVTKLAKACGVRHQAVTQWGEFVPDGSAFRLVSGRPDLAPTLLVPPTKTDGDESMTTQAETPMASTERAGVE